MRTTPLRNSPPRKEGKTAGVKNATASETSGRDTGEQAAKAPKPHVHDCGQFHLTTAGGRNRQQTKCVRLETQNPTRPDLMSKR